MPDKELTCDGCGVQATPDRLDLGLRPEVLRQRDGQLEFQQTPIYVCPVCGADMGEAKE